MVAHLGGKLRWNPYCNASRTRSSRRWGPRYHSAGHRRTTRSSHLGTRNICAQSARTPPGGGRKELTACGMQGGKFKRARGSPGPVHAYGRVGRAVFGPVARFLRDVMAASKAAGAAALEDKNVRIRGAGAMRERAWCFRQWLANSCHPGRAGGATAREASDSVGLPRRSNVGGADVGKHDGSPAA